MKALNRFHPHLELLDDRSLLSVTLTNGLLEAVGSTGNDRIEVTKSSPTQLHVTDDATGDDRTFDLASVTRILIRSRGGDDYVVVVPAITIPAEIRGWAGNDVIVGGAGNDTLLGGGGRDSVSGRGGDDTVFGQDGDDYLEGGAGNDTIFGQNGYDYIYGGNGNDTIDGGTENDFCAGDLGDDTIDGGGGDGNLCQGGGGNDTISNGTEVPIGLSGQVLTHQGIWREVHGEGHFDIKSGSDTKSFDLTLESLTPNGTATVFGGGVSMGTVQLDQFGNGELKLATAGDFPAGFPATIQNTFTLQIQVNGVNGAMYAECTFYFDLVPTEDYQLRPETPPVA